MSPSATSSFPHVGVDAVEHGLELDSRRPLFVTENAAAGQLFSRLVLDEGSPRGVPSWVAGESRKRTQVFTRALLLAPNVDAKNFIQVCISKMSMSHTR